MLGQHVIEDPNLCEHCPVAEDTPVCEQVKEDSQYEDPDVCEPTSTPQDPDLCDNCPVAEDTPVYELVQEDGQYEDPNVSEPTSTPEDPNLCEHCPVEDTPQCEQSPPSPPTVKEQSVNPPVNKRVEIEEMAGGILDMLIGTTVMTGTITPILPNTPWKIPLS